MSIILIIFAPNLKHIHMDDFRSHWWGFAALPKGFTQPYHGEDNPMTLICQFALGEGAVWVFADLDYWFGDLEAESGSLGEWDKAFYKVLYAPKVDEVFEHEIRYEDGTSAVPEEVKAKGEWLEANGSHVLGRATTWTDEIAQEFPGYEVLVQLEEDDEIGLRFYDCGSLFFLVKKEDLEARHFEDVKCVLYSY